MFLPVRTVAPAVLLTLAEAKAHMRVDAADEDALITAQIEAATSYLDGYSGVLGRALVSQSWRQDFTELSDRMALPLGPAVSITSVTYYDAADASQTLATAIYELRTDDLGAYVARIPQQSWPTLSTLRNAPVSVTFVAGYGAASAVPQAIKQAALLLISHWYENREASVIAASVAELPMAVAALIAPYRRVGF